MISLSFDVFPHFFAPLDSPCCTKLKCKQSKSCKDIKLKRKCQPYVGAKGQVMDN